MEDENRNAYSEVIEILKLIDDEKKLEALPIEMLEVIKLKANPEYKPQISIEIPLEEQNLQDDTYRILSWISTKYWNEEIKEENTDEKHNEIEKNIKIKQNEIEQEVVEQNEIDKKVIEKIEQNEDAREKIENLEKNINNKSEDNTRLPLLYKDLRWYEKIKIKIIEMLNKIFKRAKKSSNEEKGLI